MRAKGLAKNKRHCPKCHRWVDENEYDDENDICLFCEFPETSATKPAEMSYDYGDPKNKPLIDQMIEKADYLPEKQSSKQAQLREIYPEKITKQLKKTKRKYKKKKRTTYKKKTRKK